MRFFSIRTRLIIALSLILLSGFFITNLISFQSSKAQVHTTIINTSLPLARDNIYSEIQRDLTRPIFVSSLMANDTFLKDWVIAGEKDVQRIRRYLLEIRDRYGFFSSFFVSEGTKNYYHFKGILKRIGPEDDHDVWYYDFKAKNVLYDLDVDTNEAEQNHLTVFINHRLESYDGRFLGVVGVGLDFGMVARLLEEYREKYNRNIYMVDPKGTIQVHRDMGKIEKASILTEPGISRVAPSILAARNEPALFEYDIDGSHILLTSRYIKELDWFLLVEQDETLALASNRTTFRHNFFISLAITFVTIVLAILVINYFQRQLEIMATTDKLTKAYNRREFERRFNYFTAAGPARSPELSIILFDIDHLKRLNDQLGHLAGDRVIRGIARIALDTVRGNDMLVRWGGDEFVILTFNPMAQTRRIATRLRSAVCSHAFFDGSSGAAAPPGVSISCGIAQYRDTDTLDTLLARADRALYRAKENGRDCIMADTDSEGPIE